MTSDDSIPVGPDVERIARWSTDTHLAFWADTLEIAIRCLQDKDVPVSTSRRPGPRRVAG